MLRRRAATIILRKRRRIGLQCALLRSQTICSTMLGTRQLLLVEVPHARMRSEWHQLRRQLMQQQQHGKAMNYSNMPHCLRRAADPPFYPVSWVPTWVFAYTPAPPESLLIALQKKAALAKMVRLLRCSSPPLLSSSAASAAPFPCLTPFAAAASSQLVAHGPRPSDGESPCTRRNDADACRVFLFARSWLSSRTAIPTMAI